MAEGEIVALVGASGSGKSTLMNILAGLDTPTAGSVRVAGHDLAAMSPRQRLAYRRRTVGFIWQQTSRNLLPYLTAQQNVELPMRLAGGRAKDRRSRAAELLELLGLGDCRHRRPDQMSGGEQQRAAIAVAMVNEPKVLLADEPTGELDTATAAEVFGALQTANAELGVTVLIVTHDPAVSAVVRRVIAIRDGRTSAEIHRHATTGDDGEVAQHAVEYAVLDRAGRLQLPREMTEPLGMRDLVRLEAEPDHIGVWPDTPGPGMTEPRGPESAETGNMRRRGGHADLRQRAYRGPGVARRLLYRAGRPAGGAARPVWVREDHAAQHRRRARPAGRRPVRVADRDVTAMSDQERMALRRTSVAFIFQSFGLIPILSAAENVGVPLRIAGMAPKEREERVGSCWTSWASASTPGSGRRAVRRSAAAGRDRAGAGRPSAGAAR